MAQRAIIRGAGAVCAVVGLAGCAVPSQGIADKAGASVPLVNESALMGSTPAVLNAEFGRPVLLRVDGTAQVWLYHSAVCGLNLVLYPDASGTPRVALAVPDNGDPARCMASLQHILTDAANNRALEHPASS